MIAAGSTEITSVTAVDLAGSRHSVRLLWPAPAPARRRRPGAAITLTALVARLATTQMVQATPAYLA